MNAAYIYDTGKAASIITDRIYFLLETNQWSVKTLSDESNIPYETLKKLLSRKTENTSFHNIMKIALAFNCNLHDLAPFFADSSKEKSDGSFCVGSNSYTSLEATAPIPVFYPSGLTQLNIFPTSRNILSISCDELKTSVSVDYGLVVSSYYYQPVYHEKDILLINSRLHPCSGEIGIFLHQQKIYIRIFCKNNDYVLLKSVNGIGPDIRIYDFSNWVILGCVVGVHRASHTCYNR